MEIIDGESDKDESPHSTIVWGICWSGSAPGSGFLLGSSSRVLTLVINSLQIHEMSMLCRKDYWITPDVQSLDLICACASDHLNPSKDVVCTDLTLVMMEYNSTLWFKI